MISDRLKATIIFLEKPVTREEKEVSEILEEVTKAIHKKDLGLLGSLYSDHARFFFTSEEMDKEKYLSGMTGFLNDIVSFSYEEMLIKIKNKNQAICQCVRKIIRKNTNNPVLRTYGYIELEKENGKWLITKAG